MDASNTEAAGGEVASTFHHWTRLPDELKVEVLAHYLDQDDFIDESKHSIIFESHLGPIVGTRNRELTTIALETYYTRNKFKATINEIHVVSRLYYPPASYGYMIRHLQIEITDPYYLDSLDEEEWPADWLWVPWHHLLAPTKPTEAEKGAYLDTGTVAWQAHFPNFQTLRVSIDVQCYGYMMKDDTVFHGCRRCGFWTTSTQLFTELLVQSSTELKATHVTAFDRNMRDCGCLNEALSIIEWKTTKLKD
jgi:hypothetical protein